MPSVIDLTVKKYDGVTDIIYGAIKGAGGDNDPALWRQSAGQPAAFPVGLMPTLQMWGKSNGPKSARLLPLRYTYPYAVLNSTTGRYEMVAAVRFEGTWTIPEVIPASVVQEAAYQGNRLFVNASAGGVLSGLVSGYAPT